MLAADSFLMKGEEVAPHARWRGNPAGEMRELLVAPPTVASAPVPRPVVIATLVLAALIALAVSAGVALALAPRLVPPGSSSSTAVPPPVIRRPRPRSPAAGAHRDAAAHPLCRVHEGAVVCTGRCSDVRTGDPAGTPMAWPSHSADSSFAPVPRAEICPKRMHYGPCGGVRDDGSCEMRPALSVRVARSPRGRAARAAAAGGAGRADGGPSSSPISRSPPTTRRSVGSSTCSRRPATPCSWASTRTGPTCRPP